MDVIKLGCFTSDLLHIYTIMLLSTISYNCKGYFSSADYVKDIVNEYTPTVICLQETWHLDSKVSKGDEM